MAAFISSFPFPTAELSGTLLFCSRRQPRKRRCHLAWAVCFEDSLRCEIIVLGKWRALTQRQVGGEEEVDQRRSIAVTEESDLLGIAPESADVHLDPGESGLKVLEGVVPHRALATGRGEEAWKTEFGEVTSSLMFHDLKAVLSFDSGEIRGNYFRKRRRRRMK